MYIELNLFKIKLNILDCKKREVKWISNYDLKRGFNNIIFIFINRKYSIK